MASLRPALLPGGDAAARHPVQAAAGFLAAVDPQGDFCAPPFAFPRRFADARQLMTRGVRVFPASSAGRLFDTVAALVGYTTEITFEGQAAIWLEHLARQTASGIECDVVFDGQELDWRPALDATIAARRRSVDPAAIARGFHEGLARGIASAADALLECHHLDTIVVSGGVFQNALLLDAVRRRSRRGGVRFWSNRTVPSNDGGLSLGQAALATCALEKSPG